MPYGRRRKRRKRKMERYKVKATIEVEYDAECISKAASALEGAEDSVLTALSKI